MLSSVPGSRGPLSAPCLGENTILDVAAGGLQSHELARALAHLDGCARCSECLATVMSSESPLFAGRYELDERPLGMGAFGVVLRAFDVHERRWVALKVLRSHLCGDPRLEALIAAEIAAARALRHDNVCRIIDAGRVDDRVFFTMELAEGTLASELSGAWIERPLATVLADAADVVAGVAALHDAGLVHRDIKPQNILRMSDGRLTVADFGLAVWFGRDWERPLLVGTPGYMAPECALAMPADRRSDIWSLGVVLHRMLLGGSPVWHDTSRRPRLKPPGRGASVVTRRLHALVADCLDFRAEPRIGDLASLSERLSACRALVLGASRTRRACSAFGRSCRRLSRRARPLPPAALDNDRARFRRWFFTLALRTVQLSALFGTIRLLSVVQAALNPYGMGGVAVPLFAALGATPAIRAAWRAARPGNAF